MSSYHLAVVIGGLSAEMNLKTLKLASSHFLETLPKKGNNRKAFRDNKMEKSILKKTIDLKIGHNLEVNIFVMMLEL